MGKKIILYVFCSACIIALPALVISSTVIAFAGSDELYKWGFNRYHISEETGIGRTQLGRAGEAMAGYLSGSVESPQIRVMIDDRERLLYNEKEIAHLTDVRGIILFFQILLVLAVFTLITTSIALIRIGGVGRLLNIIIFGALITLGSTGLLITWALINFESLFYLFHIMSFNNDLWLLDPSKDYLIMLFPQGFFNDAAILLVVSIVLATIIVLGLAVYARKLATTGANRQM